MKNTIIYLIFMTLWGCQNNAIIPKVHRSSDSKSPANSTSGDEGSQDPSDNENPTDSQDPPSSKEPSEDTGGGDTKLNVQPMFTHRVTSGWCVKRSVGTCPHIGVDLVPGSGGVVSYAIGTGSVEKIRDVGSCGFQSQFRDNNKALWGYLHIARPSYSTGQKLFAGELIGKWYGGNSACVTGPHLHLERLEAGSYGGEKTGGNHCGTGYRNCNFDPYNPTLKMKDMKDESGRQAAISQAKGGTKVLTKVYESATVCQATALRDFPATGPRNMDDQSPLLAAQLTAEVLPNRAIFLKGLGFLTQDITQNNSCENGHICIVSWHILVRSSQSWVRLASAIGTQNTPIQIATPPFCSSSQKVFPWVLEATLSDGNVISTSSTTEAP